MASTGTSTARKSVPEKLPSVPSRNGSCIFDPEQKPHKNLLIGELLSLVRDPPSLRRFSCDRAPCSTERNTSKSRKAYFGPPRILREPEGRCDLVLDVLRPEFPLVVFFLDAEKSFRRILGYPDLGCSRPVVAK